jgi:hypothetical protein
MAASCDIGEVLQHNDVWSDPTVHTVDKARVAPQSATQERNAKLNIENRRFGNGRTQRNIPSGSQVMRRSTRRLSFAVRGLPFLLCLLGLAMLAGCKGRSETSLPSGPSNANSQGVFGVNREELLTYAIDNLNRTEEFSSDSAIEQTLQRLKTLDASKPEDMKDTLLIAWPEPEMLRQVVDRLNQWIRAQPPLADWKPDPLLAALPKPLADLPLVKDLDQSELGRFDGYALQEAVLMRDASLWARGNAQDDLERAKSLFDWTVRNIQMQPKTADWIPQFPWETLLFGRGTTEDRAWVFILLAQQQGIDAALLALPPAAASPSQGNNASPSQGNKEKKNEGSGKDTAATSTPARASATEQGKGGPTEEKVQAPAPRLWCAGVLIEGNVYLFDPSLGLPIPGPHGVTRGSTGELLIQPATLAQAAADDGLLRRLDADPAHPYPVKASDLQHVSVLLAASPTCLARRMRLVESHLAGVNKMVLTVAPSAQAEHWKAAKLPGAQLWLQPFETIEVRSHLDAKALQACLLAMLPFYGDRSAPLLKGRMLHLKGKLVGADGAIHYYLTARPSNQDLRESPGVGQTRCQLLVRLDRVPTGELPGGHRLPYHPHVARGSRWPMDFWGSLQSCPHVRGLRRNEAGRFAVPVERHLARLPRQLASRQVAGPIPSLEGLLW